MIKAIQHKLQTLVRKFKHELLVCQLVLSDARTPAGAKALLGLAVSFALLPFDLIPDFIPIVGLIDDAIIVPALVITAMRMVPKEVVADCRERAYQMSS